MGLYLEPDDAKIFSLVDRVKLLDSDVLDERFILPAEEVLKQAFRLEVNTDGEPWKWCGTFDERADLRMQYWADCKRAVIMIVDALALNPHGVLQQSSAGISAAYGPIVPEPARAIMNRWGKTGSVFRS